MWIPGMILGNVESGAHASILMASLLAVCAELTLRCQDAMSPIQASGVFHDRSVYCLSVYSEDSVHVIFGTFHIRRKGLYESIKHGEMCNSDQGLSKRQSVS